jgi:hypothetical protein
MLFVLRSERAPSRIVRETDEEGIERTFWLWRHGAWVVAMARGESDGDLGYAHDPALEVTIQRTGDVVVVSVRSQPLAPTLPAPPLEELPSVSISAVIPVAPRVGDFAEFLPRSGSTRAAGK